MSDIRINILHTRDCTGAPRALDEAGLAVDNLRIAARVSAVLIEDEATAHETGFRGSPTVTVDGMKTPLQSPRTRLQRGVLTSMVGHMGCGLNKGEVPNRGSRLVMLVGRTGCVCSGLVELER